MSTRFCSSLLVGGMVLVASPAVWAAIAISDVRLQSIAGGVELTLETEATGDRPQIFIATQGNTWTADIVDTRLTDPSEFRQADPAPGIAAIAVVPLDVNSVRIVVSGTDTTPSAQLSISDRALTFAIYSDSNPPSTSQTSELSSVPSDQVPPLPNTPLDTPPIVLDADADRVPPLLPRAIAPAVGDIAVATTDATPATIDLGTDDIVPRLVLRQAPVREVLALLARASGLNLAYDETVVDGDRPPEADSPDIQISLDVENEPLQSIFNSVLTLTRLEANRQGNTIFVAPKLPNPARNTIIRSLRMNQVTVATALNFLVGMGAESAVSRERLITNVNAVAVALPEDIAQPPPITQTQTTTEERIEPQRVAYIDSEPPLRGLLVLGDERTNMLTLVGRPQQVEIATAQLVQLDVRRRQAAINVRVVDINLAALNEFNTSFSFGINDTFVSSDEDGFSIDFDNSPNNNPFTALLETQITDGNAKILTDPTLIVQEGQSATVALTEEVPTTTGETTFNEQGDLVTFEQDDPRAAGLTLVVQIDRIDDNGFISLSVAPTITAPTGEQENPDGSITTLLSARSLESGQIRLRDGQTLILSGIIQDSDRATVSKVPILGDLPILGALFRQTERESERREVIVLLTPQVINDSERSTFGYSYTPSPEAQELLQRSPNSSGWMQNE